MRTIYVLNIFDLTNRDNAAFIIEVTPSTNPIGLLLNAYDTHFNIESLNIYRMTSSQMVTAHPKLYHHILITLVKGSLSCVSASSMFLVLAIFRVFSYLNQIVKN